VITVGPLRQYQVAGADRNRSRIDNCQDLTIAVVDYVSRNEVNAVLVKVVSWIEREVGNFPVPARSRGEALTSRLLGLKDEIHRKCAVLEVVLIRQGLEVDLLGVVIVLWIN